MVHDVRDIREDIAFMRAMAQEGRRAPLLIGQGLVEAGVVFGVASLFAGAVQARLLPLSPAWEGWIWPLATAVYLPYARWRRRSCTAGKPGAAAVGNRAVRAAMQGIGYAFLALLLGSFALGYVTRTSVVFAMWPPAALAIYGSAWWVAAAMSETRWIRGVGVACYALAVLTGFTTATPYGYLVFAVALLAVTAAPGVLLMRAEPPRAG